MAPMNFHFMHDSKRVLGFPVPGFRSSLVLSLVFCAAVLGQAQNFVYRFDDTLDAQVRIVSTTLLDRPLARTTGGNPGGYLALTDARSETATLVMLPGHSGNHPVKSFVLTADVRVGNRTAWAAADGFCICFAAPDDPVFTADKPFEVTAVANNPETGTTTGLVVMFKSFVYGQLPDSEIIEGLIVRLDNKTLFKHPMPVVDGAPTDPASIQTGPRDPSSAGAGDAITWQPLRIEMSADGKLSVRWKNTLLVDGLATGFTPRPGRWVLGARAGGANQNHHIDNLAITQDGMPEDQPYLLHTSKSANGMTLRVRHAAATRFNSGNTTLQIDDQPVQWKQIELTQASATESVLAYRIPFPGYFAPGAARRARLVLKAPSGPATSLAADFSASIPVVSLPDDARRERLENAQPGFHVRAWQLPVLGSQRDMLQPHNMEWTESVLAGLTGTNLIDAARSARVLGSINFGPMAQVGKSGAFPGDLLLTDLTGRTNLPANNLNTEIRTWIEFPAAGLYRMAITSGDGYRLSVGERVTRQGLEILAPAAIAGPAASMSAGEKEPFGSRTGTGYGPALPMPPLQAEAVFAEPRLGCEPLTNPEAIRGKIAILYRGDCYFAAKTRRAQEVGALAVVIINHGDGYPGRMDNPAEDITIPTLQVPASVGRLLETHRVGLRLSIGRDTNPVLNSVASGGSAVRNEFALFVSRPGFYPLRLVHYTIQGDGILEWISIAEDGTPRLLNDHTPQKTLRAYAP